MFSGRALQTKYGAVPCIGMPFFLWTATVHGQFLLPCAAFPMDSGNGTAYP